jgi:hypothetical protein
MADAQAEEADDEAQEGLTDEQLKERLKTEAVQQVVDAGFPLTREDALRTAGHRRVEVGDVTLTVNMILSKLRGDDWRTGGDFRDAVDRAWDDIKESYI